MTLHLMLGLFVALASSATNYNVHAEGVFELTPTSYDTVYINLPAGHHAMIVCSKNLQYSTLSRDNYTTFRCTVSTYAIHSKYSLRLTNLPYAKLIVWILPNSLCYNNNEFVAASYYGMIGSFTSYTRTTADICFFPATTSVSSFYANSVPGMTSYTGYSYGIRSFGSGTGSLYNRYSGLAFFSTDSTTSSYNFSFGYKISTLYSFNTASIFAEIPVVSGNSVVAGPSTGMSRHSYSYSNTIDPIFWEGGFAIFIYAFIAIVGIVIFATFCMPCFGLAVCCTACATATTASTIDESLNNGEYDRPPPMYNPGYSVNAQMAAPGAQVSYQAGYYQ